MFFREVLNFEPDEWQAEAARDLAANPKVSIKSGQGVGKTGLEAAVFLWFITCFPYPRIVATAPTKQQLHDVLWSEISKWMSKSELLSMLLKGLEVGKVDFVDEGANQRADIKLLKGKNKAEETSDPEIGLFKRFLNWISGEVQKSATTFDEQINAVSMDAIRDEIWSVCYALQNSLNSILCDPELDSSGKQSAMDTSIEQFATAMKEYIPGWAGGTSAKIKKNLDAPDETDLPMVMKAHSNLEEIIQKSVETKGELEDILWSYNADDRYHHNIHRLLGYTRSFRQNRL